MSEMKVYTHIAEELDAEAGNYALYAYDVDGIRTKIDDTELVYLKSEADKVIAELEESHKKEVGQLLIEIDELKKACKDKDDFCAHMLKENRHNKYKRCLDKADLCDARYDKDDAKVNGCGASWDYESKEMEFWERWRWRWLKIADKFKKNSTINRKGGTNALQR